jgi:hypothetical protein
MILIIYAILLSVIFFLIGCLHFYWAVGGKWAIDNVVPTNYKGEKVLRTGVVASFVVGTGLIIFSLYYLVKIQYVEIPAPVLILNSLGWIIPSIFLFRAIGDFKYVGFTKKVKGTTFAKLDTTYFSKLCLLIALLGFIVQLN